jgi:uncharacterized membrane protein YgcG
VPSGEGFTEAQVREISRAAATATAQTGLHFSVYVGGVEGDARSYAERLHTALGALAQRGVLLVVSPADRQLEIVTGSLAARRLTDRACALAALSMTTAFAGGDLVGGIVTGLRMLSESAGRELVAG